MRRALGVLVGLVLASPLAVISPAEAVPAETTLSTALPVDEGPAPSSGSQVGIVASLQSGGEPVVGVPVALFSKAYGSTSWRLVGTDTSNQFGSVLVEPRLYRTSQLRWSFKGDAEHAHAVSNIVVRTIGPRVGARAHDATIPRNQQLDVYGRTWPAKPGSTVTLWIGQVPCFCPPYDGPSGRLTKAIIKPDGSYELHKRFTSPGHFQLFVKVEGGNGTTTGYSRYFYIQVR